MTEAWSNNPMIMAMGWSLLHSLWLALFIAIVARLLFTKVGPERARSRYWISLGSLFVLLLTTAGIFVRHYAAFTMPEMSGPATGNSASATETTFAVGGAEIWSLLNLWVQLEDYFPVLVLLWLLGSTFMGLRLLGGYWYLHQIAHRDLQMAGPEWTGRFNQLRTKMGVRRQVRLYWSEQLDAPITLRHLRPIVLFPLGLLSQLDSEQVEMVLLHELAHIRRWDYLVNWLQSLVELLFFYHPAVWWLSAQVRTAREHCCDDLVLATAQPRLLYARTLTQVSGYSLDFKTKLVMSYNGNNQSFTFRVKRLLGATEPARSGQPAILSSLLVLVLLGLVFLSTHNLKAGDVTPLLVPAVIHTDTTDPGTDKLWAELDTLPEKTGEEQVLLIIDDVPAGFGRSKLAVLEADSIASVNIYKDEAAVKKYGTDARQGAIEVYTMAYIAKREQEYPAPEAEPLLVVDGQIIGKGAQLDGLDPALIASVNVLKGASATEQYGAQGKDGVVEIVTKQSQQATTTSMKLGKTLKKSVFKYGPEGQERRMDPLVVVNEQPVGKVSAVGRQYRTAESEFLMFRGPSAATTLQYGPAASEGVLLFYHVVEEGATTTEMQSSAAAVPERGGITGLQVAPNPTGASTHISFELEEASLVKISVFNATGRLIKVLADADLPAGYQQFTWDATALASGTYTVVLEAGGQRIAKPVVRQ